MALIAVQTTWAPSDKLTATALNAEFSNIVGVLDGSTNANVELSYNNSDIPNLTINNTGSGVLQSWEVNGTETLKVDANGVLQSTVATGTAPFVVASTTKVTNLNADTLDGVNSTAFAQLASNNTFTGGAQSITHATSAGLTLTSGSKVGSISIASAVGDLVLSSNSGFATATMEWAGADAAPTFTPDGGSAQNVLLEGNAKVDFAESWYFSTIGGISVNDYVYIAYNGRTTIEGFYYTYLSGSPSGNSTITVKHYNSTGTLQTTYTTTLASGDTAGTVYTNNTSDFTLGDKEYLLIEPGTDNGHDEVIVTAYGYKEVFD